MVNTPVELHLSTSVIMLSASSVENPTTSAITPAEPQKSKKSKKLKLIKISLAIPDVQLASQGISKLADNKREKYVVPVKHILKPATTPKLALPVDKIKPLDLTFIDAAPFQYLAKQKNVEIFVVFM